MFQYLEPFFIVQLVLFPVAPFWIIGTFFDATLLVLRQLIFTIPNFRLQYINYFCQQKVLSPQFVINFNYVSVFQVKDKSLDTIYRAISYTQRPKHSDLDLGKDLPRLSVVHGSLALHNTHLCSDPDPHGSAFIWLS
jgi:hypothetical protein